MIKFLKVLICLIVFTGIVLLCYFFGTPKEEIKMPVGKYYLEKIIEKIDEEDKVETEYKNGDLYIEVLKNKKIKSYSSNVGFVQSEIEYTYEVNGTNLSIKDSKEEKYTGMFAEKLIIIELKETIIDGENEKEKITEYYYMLR